MQRDAERVDRFTKTIGPDLFACLSEEWLAIGGDAPVQESCFPEVAIVCRKADLPPEAMLVAVRILSRSFFPSGTLESDRVEKAWHRSVQVMMTAYYSEAPPVAR